VKLRKITIHNFRGVLDQTILVKDFGLLVGPNNSGKSTVIDAIRAFYEKEGFKFQANRDFPFTPTIDTESWVELMFQLKDDEDETLAEEYRKPSKLLRVRKYFKAADKNREGYIYAVDDADEPFESSFYGAKNVQSGKLGDIVFIPAVSKVDEHTKLSGPSALRDLLTNVLEAVVESSPSFQRFSGDFSTFAKGIKADKTTDGRSLEGLESDLTYELETWDAMITLDLRSPTTAEIVKTLLTYECVDNAHGRSITMDQCGSGLQRHIIYSLIKLGARYITKKPSRKTKDFTPSLSLILFEEPEAFLHPPQQEALARNLSTLATNPDQQVLCSTHSSHFVSRNTSDIPAIARLRRCGAEVIVSQIDEQSWAEIVDANQVLNAIAERYPKLRERLEEDDQKPEMEAIKYFLWLNPDRSSAFFANHVLLVEGQTEVAFVNRLVDDEMIDNGDCGLFVLDCMGKFNIHRFMNLLGHLGVSHSVLYDDDDDAGFHEELNQLIEDSRQANLTEDVVRIPGKLETLLGVEGGKSYRKPQHLLYQYETGQIDRKRVEEFCELIGGSLPERAKRQRAETESATE
jgi:putative ATP-dependent endonuclease of the OLD family